jgi:tetratricopeptide (TPR) repeat protein
MTRALVPLSALLAVLCSMGADAHAQRRGRRDAGREEALELFRQSETEYQAGRFADAAALLQRAWQRHEEPILLWNLGRAWEGAGEPGKAIEAYRRYLQAAPRAEDRTTVEAKIAELERQVRQNAEQERRQAEDDARARREADQQDRRSVDEDERERRRRLRGDEGRRGPGIAPWILVGAGGVSLGAGGLFGLLATSRHDAAEADPVQRSARDKQDGAETFATLANVAFVAGTVMAAGGVTWVILGGRGDDESADDGTEEEEEEEESDDDLQVRGPGIRISFGPGAILVDGRFP